MRGQAGAQLQLSAAPQSMEGFVISREGLGKAGTAVFSGSESTALDDKAACPGLHNSYLLQSGSQALLPFREHQPQIGSQASFTEAAAASEDTRPP